MPDFYFTGDDYRYRFRPESKQRFLDLIRKRFNSPVSYKGGAFKWDIVIEQKTAELGRYLVGRTGTLDFSEPSPNLHRADDRDLRRRIPALTQREAQKLGIGKRTLHYLDRKARDYQSFTVYSKVRSKIGAKHARISL